MIAENLITLLDRDLSKLKEEILLYKNESTVWIVPDGILNSAGNLTMHLVGNLNHFIGAVLGKTGYIRQRDREFSNKNIPLQDIIKSIEETKEMIRRTLSDLNKEQLLADYPEEFLGKRSSTLFVLTQLAVHLAYHLGQVNYHRRLLKMNITRM